MRPVKIQDLWTLALDLGNGLVSSTRVKRTKPSSRTSSHRHAPPLAAVRMSGASSVHAGRSNGANKAHVRASGGPLASFTASSPAQKRKIQALLDFTPQSNLFSKARYPRIARNRWVESSVEQFPSVHMMGQRLQATDDDRALNIKIQTLKDEFLNKVKDLRVAVKGKLKVEVRSLDAFATPRLIIKSLDGKTWLRPDGNTLRQVGIRGGGMELRRALEIASQIKSVHKDCVSLSKDIARAHHDLAVVVGKHRRRGSTELIFTEKIFNQIKELRVFPTSDLLEGSFCPTPFLQMECFRIHATLMARAIASHLTLVNQLYNRRTSLKRRAVGTTRPASFSLATGRFTALSLPLLEWRLSMRLKDGRYIMRDTVQRTTFSKVRGRVLREQTESVASVDGSLSMPAVAYASLLHMGDEYHAVEAARFAFTRVISNVIGSARSIMSVRSNSAVRKAEWAFSDRLITPNQLQIPIDVFAR